MKKVLLCSLLTLLAILNSFAVPALSQESKASNAKTSPDTVQQPCLSKSGEKLENKDFEVNLFIENISAFTDKLVSKVYEAANLADGLAAAQAFMDAQQREMKGQVAAFIDTRACQLSEHVRKNLQQSLYQNGVKVGQLTANYGSDAAAKLKIQKLTQDFLEIFRSESAGNANRNTPMGDPKVSPLPCPRESVENRGKMDAQVISFLADLDSFTNELVRKVETAANPAAGVEAAQKLMDAQKPLLRARFDSMKKITRCEVSLEIRLKLQDGMHEDGLKIGILQAKYGSVPAVKARLQKLTQDFLDIFKM